MRTFTSIILLAAMFLCCGPARAEKHMLLVALQNPPMTFAMPDGQAGGFNAVISKEALRRLGYSVEIHIVPWSRALAMVRSGQADGIIDAAFTAERSQYLRYPATPIYEERYFAFQRATSDIRLDPDLTGAGNLTVGIDQDYFYGRRLTSLLTTPTFARVEATVGIESNIRKLLNNRVDIIIEQAGPLWSTAKKLDVDREIKTVPSLQDGTPLLLSISRAYLAFSKKKVSRELVDECNKHLKDMRDEGFFTKIRQAYE